MGTSLPELAVDLTTLRKKQYEIVIGDVIGSCVVDTILSIRIGQVFFPQAVSGELASLLVILTLAIRRKWIKEQKPSYCALSTFIHAVNHMIILHQINYG